jgi:hypothetical protein
MKQCICNAVVVVTLFATTAMAQEKDTRAGNCEDAKSQVDYFCNGKGNPNDIMVQAPIACNNAKNNMAAACDGRAEKDLPYKFEDKK